MSEVNMSQMKVFNLEFPAYCDEFTIYNYTFRRVDNYEEQYLNMQHRTVDIHEFNTDLNYGKHVVSAIVTIPNKEQPSIIEWSHEKPIALDDILLLLSLFTKREVFILKPNLDEHNDILILEDHRIFQYGGILRASLPFKRKNPTNPYSYNICFENELNRIYKRMRTTKWKREYGNGYYLLLVKSSFKYQILETAFIQCWTIWEHLYALHNHAWLSQKELWKINAAEKISFILVKYAIAGEVNEKDKIRIKALSSIRNKLVHNGRFPSRESVHDDAVLFIRLTELIIAKTLGIHPKDIFNSIKALEDYLAKNQ